MLAENILRADVLDLLFENRNKQYGAYELRKQYDRRLAMALMGMALLAGMLVLLFMWQREKLATPDFIPEDNVLTTIILPPVKPEPVPLKPAPASTQKAVATVKNSTIKIVPDNLADSKVPTVDDMLNKKIGTDNMDGPEPDGTVQPLASSSNGTGTEPAPEPPAAPAPEQPLLKASLMPAFPGGEGALMRWLSKNLRPQENQEPGQRVKVVVRFVVGPTGTIDRIQLVQEGGEQYDNEVLRVVKKMPAWTPGQQDGRPVAVWFSIPVIFETGD